MTYVLLTRPLEDAMDMAHQLLAPSICEPMLIVIPHISKIELPEGTTDLIVTSPRVFDLLENITDFKDKPIWCVGDVTAEKAKAKGFETIHTAQRSAQDLLEDIVQKSPRDKSHFLHLRGNTVHVDIVNALKHVHFKADQKIIYETIEPKEFSNKFKILLKDHLIQLAPFYSQKTAESFITLAKQSFDEKELVHLFSPIEALAHSEAIATVLKELPWKTIRIINNLSIQQIDQLYLEKQVSKIPPKQEKTSPSLFLISTLTVSSAILGAIGSALLIQPSSPIIQTDLTEINHKINQYSQNISEITTIQNNLLQQLSAHADNHNKLIELEEKINILSDKINNFDQPNLISTSIPNDTPSPQEQINTVRQHLLSSTLSPIDIQTLQELSLSPSPSIPQLIERLSSLDFQSETTEPSLKNNFLERLMIKFGIKIKRASTQTLKSSIIKDLQIGSFDFLKDPKIQNKQNFSPIEQDWLEDAQSTDSLITILHTLLTPERINP